MTATARSGSDGAAEQRFCLRCGEAFSPTTPDGALCPTCGPSRPSAPVQAQRRTPAPRPGGGPSRPSAPVQPQRRTPAPQPGGQKSAAARLPDSSWVLAHCVPPLADFALGREGLVYAVDTTLGGQACSLICFQNGEFQSSSMLRVPEPLGLAMLPDGRPVVIGRRGAVVVVGGLATASGEELPATQGYETHWGLSCSAHMARSSILALGVPAERAIFLMEAPKFQHKKLADGLHARPTALAFSTDGRRLAAGLNDGELLVVDVAGCRPLWKRMPDGFEAEGVVAVAAAADGGWAVAYESHHLAQWDAQGVMRAACHTARPLSALHADPGTGRVAAGDQHGNVAVWAPGLDAELVAGKAHDSAIVRIILLPRASMLVSGGEGGQVKVNRLA